MSKKTEEGKYFKVNFKPWIGKYYQHGVIGFDEKGHIVYGTKDNSAVKILVLGDSHYCANVEDAKPTLTKDVITYLLDPESAHEPYMNTYKKFIKSFTGYFEELTDGQKRDAWEHIMFYNYVQKPMTAARIAPLVEDYRESDEAFKEVLETSDADIVIAWGKRLYNNLPSQSEMVGEQDEDLEIMDGDYEGEAIEVWRYKVKKSEDEKWVPIIGITHPSAAFALEYWGTIIRAFIERAITNKGK